MSGEIPIQPGLGFWESLSGDRTEYLKESTSSHIPTSIADKYLNDILSSRDMVLGFLDKKGAPNFAEIRAWWDVLEILATQSSPPSQSIFAHNQDGTPKLTPLRNQVFSSLSPWFALRLSRSINGQERRQQTESTSVRVFEGQKPKSSILSKLFGGK